MQLTHTNRKLFKVNASFHSPSVNFNEKFRQTECLPANLVARAVGNARRREPVTHQDEARVTDHIQRQCWRRSGYCFVLRTALDALTPYCYIVCCSDIGSRRQSSSGVFTRHVFWVPFKWYHEASSYTSDHYYRLIFHIPQALYITADLVIQHLFLVLRPSWVPKKVGVNQKGVNQIRYSHKKKRLK